ncbi:MAG: nicotinate-nucleotide adenylyltransferase, partial [Ectothiorhodospira sp.]
VAAVVHRAKMVERAVEGQPGFRLDPRELHREGPSYTVDTLRDLRAEVGEAVPLCLMLGMDAFAGLSSWHRWQEISELAHIVVSHRPGSPASHDLGDWMDDRRTHDPAMLRQAPVGRVLFLPVTQLDISATAIRGTVARGRSPQYLLPRRVAEYIEREGLYRPAAS